MPENATIRVRPIIFNASNHEIELILASVLGPKTINHWHGYVLALVYIIILLTGLVGNCCTCYVIINNRRMKTVTNFYLFSLAVADILTLVIGEILKIDKYYFKKFIF